MSLMTVVRELVRYELDLVGVQEIGWEGGRALVNVVMNLQVP